MELYFSLFRSIQQTKEDQQKKKLVAPHTRKEGTQKPSQKKKAKGDEPKSNSQHNFFFIISFFLGFYPIFGSCEDRYIYIVFNAFWFLSLILEEGGGNW